MNLKVAQKIWARLDVRSAASPNFQALSKAAREISRYRYSPRQSSIPYNPLCCPAIQIAAFIAPLAKVARLVAV